MTVLKKYFQEPVDNDASFLHHFFTYIFVLSYVNYDEILYTQGVLQYRISQVNKISMMSEEGGGRQTALDFFCSWYTKILLVF